MSDSDTTEGLASGGVGYEDPKSSEKSAEKQVRLTDKSVELQNPERPVIKTKPHKKEETTSDQDQDLNELRKTCSLITRTLRKLNANAEVSSHSKVRESIDQLNQDVEEILHEVRHNRKRQEKEQLTRKPSTSHDKSVKKPSHYTSKSNDGGSTRPKTNRFTPKTSSSSSSSDEDITSDSESSVPSLSDNSCQESDNSEKSVHRHRSKQRSKRTKHSTEVLRSKDVSKLLTRLDNRMTPRPVKFDGHSGQSLREYLEMFEDYCSQAFKGSSTFWVGELGRYLSGEMYQAYNTLKSVGDDYATIKKKLLKWRKDSKEAIENKTRNRFHRASMKRSEGLRMYAARLEQAFKLAYPGKPVNTSNTLRRKYFETVPDNVRTQLIASRSMGMAMNKKDMTWSTVRTVVSSLEADTEITSNSDSDSDKVSAMWSQKPSRKSEQRGRKTDKPFNGKTRTWHRSNKPNENRSHTRPSNQRAIEYPSQRPKSKQRTSTENKSQSKRNSSDSDSSVETRTCRFCRKKGHIKVNCWRYRGFCLVCGSAEHRIADCPHKRELRQSRDSSSDDRNNNTVSRRSITWSPQGSPKQSPPRSPTSRTSDGTEARRDRPPRSLNE